jgi:ribose transport system permease protein
VLVGFLGLQAFIATLAMMAFARGLAKQICQTLADGAKITKYPTPPSMEALNAHVEVLGTRIAVAALALTGCAALTLFLLRCTTFGVRVYAVGDNEEAARVAGLPVRRVKVLVYTYAGAMAGIAGVFFAAMERQGNPDGGVGYELTAIAMVVIGGTSLAGGRGGMMLTVLGMLTIGYLRKILDLNSIETPMQLMITGVIIVLAVVVPGAPARWGRLRRGGA